MEQLTIRLVIQMFSSETSGSNLKYWKWWGPWKMAIWYCDKITKDVSIAREKSQNLRWNPISDKTDHDYSDIPATVGSFLFIWSTTDLYR